MLQLRNNSQLSSAALLSSDGAVKSMDGISADRYLYGGTDPRRDRAAAEGAMYSHAYHTRYQRAPAGDDSPSVKAKRKRRVSADGTKPRGGAFGDGSDKDKMDADQERMAPPPSSFMSTMREDDNIVLGPLPSCFGSASGRQPRPSAAMAGGASDEGQAAVVAAARGAAIAARLTGLTAARPDREDPGGGGSRSIKVKQPGEADAFPSSQCQGTAPKKFSAQGQYASKVCAQDQLRLLRDQYAPKKLSPGPSTLSSTHRGGPAPSAHYSPNSSRSGETSGSPSASVHLHRPRKQSRGSDHHDHSLPEDVHRRIAAEGNVALRREKQGLIEKLRTYASSEQSEDDDFDDDDEDEWDPHGYGGHSKAGAFGLGEASLPHAPIPHAPIEPRPQWGEPPRKVATSPERTSPISSVEARAAVGQKPRGSLYPPPRRPPLGHQLAATQSRFEQNIMELQGRSSTKMQSAIDVFSQVHSDMSEKYNGRRQGFKSSVAAIPPDDGRRNYFHSETPGQSLIAASSNPRGNSFHSKTSLRRGASALSSALSSREREGTDSAKAIFVNLEAQIMQKEGPYHAAEYSSSSQESPPTNQQKPGAQRSPPLGGNSYAATPYPSTRIAAGLPPFDGGRQGTAHPHGAPFPNDCHVASQSLSRATGHVAGEGSAGGSQPTRYGEAPSSRNSVIANMDVVTSQRKPHPQAGDDGSAAAASRWRSHRGGGLASGSFQRRMSSSHTAVRARDAAGSRRGPSREVIASIEADMMRLEEEEETRGRMEMDASDCHGQHGRDLYGRMNGDARGRPSAGMNQPDVLSIMMMHQHHRGHSHRDARPPGGHAGAGYNRTLADQISNMALIDPQTLRAAAADDHSETASIASCVSYDGKCTNVFASRARTHDQELACHALNDAICDLYGAPVGGILGRYPAVTRLIRADDETGNVQLHYAVRNGNVKAIRRIVRADPGCALIRNIQGYCPLHFAVQIGNFAAVQLLCCMAPASAEVQCEEGCLPLHESVSSAAHLPDAPQIAAALINAFPSAIKITNDEGLLPLHLAAMSGFSAGIRTIFAYGFSTIYARENTEEMLPVDFAIDGYASSAEEADERRRNEPGSDVSDLTKKEMEFRHCIDIFLMSALYDRPVFTPARNDQRGMTFLPIHGAAASQPCSQSWKRIVSMYGTDYASDVDVRGRTALHVLVTSTPWYLEVVTEMIWSINELDPTSATTFDDSGLLPLHAALANHAPYHVVEHLLLCNWSTVSMEVDEDCDTLEFRGMLPFQLAAACGCGIEVVDLLLRAHPIGVAGALPEY